MKKYLVGLVLFLSASLFGCSNVSNEQQIGEGTGSIENNAESQEKSSNRIPLRHPASKNRRIPHIFVDFLPKPYIIEL